MNPFLNLAEEDFLVGETDLRMFHHRPHRLEWGIIFFCISGKAVISTQIISHEISLHTKATLLPGTIFTLQEASEDFKVNFIAFSHSLFSEAHYRLEPSFIRFLYENPIYQVPEEKRKVLMSTFAFFNHIYRDCENRFRYEIVRNQLQCIFWETYDKTHRLFEHIKTTSSYSYIDLFRKFVSLMHEYSKREREVTFYADQLCVTPRYLSFITRQVTINKSAKDMINEHIILEIKLLLQSTQLSIQEIANQLNFPDQSYLGRYFKRYTGKSPSEYRMQMGGQ